jgi:putative molybdopterin biosynthesis protein
MALREELLTTAEVAELLRVHPKQVYRLLRRGLPARRVGGEWRFSPDEVLRWSRAGQLASTSAGAPAASATEPPRPGSFLAANGDVVMELLLQSFGDLPALGVVPADQASGLDLLRRNEVLVAGCHGQREASLGGERLVFIHLVEREIGLAMRRGVKLPKLGGIRRLRVASRPPTAGMRPRFDAELRKSGVDPEQLHGQAVLLRSNLDIVCAVARRDADVGLASAAWAQKTGLSFRPLFTEAYGLTLRAADLGNPRVVRLCEAVQGAAFQGALAKLAGYDTQKTGAIVYPT